MSEAIKPTPGPWEAEKSCGDEWWFGGGNGGEMVIRQSGPGYREPIAVMGTNLNHETHVDANFRLIAEAGTVFHETQCTPRQLVERVKELEAAARPFANYACSPPGHCDCHNCKARDLLSKALPNTVAEVK